MSANRKGRTLTAFSPFDVEKRSDEIYALRGVKTVLLFGSVCRNKINDYFYRLAAKEGAAACRIGRDAVRELTLERIIARIK